MGRALVLLHEISGGLCEVVDHALAIFALGVDGLKEYIKTIGLFNSKAENIIQLCKILIEQHDSQVPRTREALEALYRLKTLRLTPDD